MKQQLSELSETMSVFKDIRGILKSKENKENDDKKIKSARKIQYKLDENK